ncbi:MAG: hypothetical protein ABR583_04570 [Gaiellaceae bacterium]
MKRADGADATHLDPGAYTVRVVDEGDLHNFHVKGPGVDRTTDVIGTGTVSWDVEVTDGTYTYLCDVHPTSMRKTFTVGTPPVVTPPPPKPPSCAAPSARGRQSR